MESTSKQTKVDPTKPANEQQLWWTSGDTESDEGEWIPAIDQRWCVEREYGRFYTLTSNSHLHVKSWRNDVKVVQKSVHYLRQLPFHEFWPVMLYDQDCRDMLHSFLRYCPRPHDDDLYNLMFNDSSLKGVADLAHDVYRSMFLCVLRMIDMRDSSGKKAGFLSRDFFIRVLREHQLFTIPRLLDICALYGHTNPLYTRQIVKVCFDEQPAYKDDLKQYANVLMKVFDGCARKVAADIMTVGSNANVKGPMLTTGATTLEKDSMREVCYLLLDISSSWLAFLKVSKHVVGILHEQGVTKRLPVFYESVYVPLAGELSDTKHIGGFHYDKTKHRKRLVQFERDLLVMFRLLVQHNLLSTTNNSNNETADRNAHEFIQIIVDNLDQPEFIWTYDKEYSIVDELRSLAKHAKIDSTQIEYIERALADINQTQAEQTFERLKRRGALMNAGQVSANDLVTRSAIDTVLSILPDLGDAFVHVCLCQFSMDPELTIDALLNESGKLTKDLRKLRLLKNLKDRLSGKSVEWKSPLQPETINESPTASTSRSHHDVPEMFTESAADVSSSNTTANVSTAITNSNTSENDQITMLNAAGLNVPMGHGKKHGNTVKDKTMSHEDREHLRAFYEERQFESEMPDEFLYDDEYDDTYDDQIVVDDADTPEDRLRMLRINNPNRGPVMQREDDTEEKNATAAQNVPTNNNNAPAEGHSNAPYVVHQRGDYTGGVQRQYRDRNRQRFAHHNRKAMAQKKQRGGMF